MKTKKNLLGAAAAIIAVAMLTIPATALAQDPVGKSRTPSKQASKTRKPAGKKAAAKKAPAKAAPQDDAIEDAPEVYHAPAEEGGEAQEAPAKAPAEEAAPEETEAAEAEADEGGAEDNADGLRKPRGNASEADWAGAEEGSMRRRGENRDAEEPAAAPAEEAEPAAAPLATSVMPPYAINPGGPDTLEWKEGMAIPPGYKKGTKVRKGLVIGGAITFGASWLLSIAAATALIEEEQNDSYYTYDERTDDGYYTTRRRKNDDDDFPDAAALYIPLAGPFIAIHTMNAKNEQAAVLALDGAVQLAGFSMFVAGLAAKKTVLVRDTSVEIAAAPGPGSMMFQAKW